MVIRGRVPQAASASSRDLSGGEVRETPRCRQANGDGIAPRSSTADRTGRWQRACCADEEGPDVDGRSDPGPSANGSLSPVSSNSFRRRFPRRCCRFRSENDDPIGVPDDVEVVLIVDHAVLVFNELIHDGHHVCDAGQLQPAPIREVVPGDRLEVRLTAAETRACGLAPEPNGHSEVRASLETQRNKEQPQLRSRWRGYAPAHEAPDSAIGPTTRSGVRRRG